ncbi:Bloom syndrome protein homolog isoform X1 [Trichogramma pretiosum]|uniref:Bloom syndrome protein homolog isoform X1 n=1 Tax=Trichogramma pretiosum TaxID=7493 RepID=UPI0006C99895|nr:Bloom syndrome protein homolog isoform X1 [Trichogramma pretiosum]
MSSISSLSFETEFNGRTSVGGRATTSNFARGASDDNNNRPDKTSERRPRSNASTKAAEAATYENESIDENILNCSSCTTSSPSSVSCLIERMIRSPSGDTQSDTLPIQPTSKPRSERRAAECVQMSSSGPQQTEDDYFVVNLAGYQYEDLGMDAKLNEWIKEVKSNPVMKPSRARSQKLLNAEKLNLQDLQIQAYDHFYNILCKVPQPLLANLPGYDAEVFERLKILVNNIKARVKQTNSRILKYNDDHISLSSDSQSSKPTYSASAELILPSKNAQNLTLKVGNGNIINKSVNTIGINNNWMNGSKTQIESLPTCTAKTSVENKKNNIQSNYNKFIDEDILKVDPNELIKKGFCWNDSEEFDDILAPGVNKEAVSNICAAQTVSFIGNVKDDGNDPNFNNFDFPHSRNLLHLFKNKFGLHQFRPNQLPAINAIILNLDCFILMPTGGGKSLCYQLPALLAPGITIVISPLRSLILDQTQKLSSLDIPAAYLTGDLNEDQVAEIYHSLKDDNCDLKLLYITPEKLSASSKLGTTLGQLYRKGRLSRFVIDEVHCVSQWGHDFRPDYTKLRVLRDKFPNVPIIALTATATPRVRSDILNQLHLNSPKWFISSFNRPNLRYTIMLKKPKSQFQQVLELIRTKFQGASGIVYCISRRDCDELAKLLQDRNISAISYHAGLEDKLRTERQMHWVSEKVKVICATIAFGMGIDKPNVRFVIHAAMPKSIEGYYQESGRAGRDGEPADCILLYSYGDIYRYRFLMADLKLSNPQAYDIHMDNLYKIVNFCENLSDCRRVLQLNYFGEKFDRQQCIENITTTCDNCKTHDQFENLDVTEDARDLIRLIQSLDSLKKYNVTLLQVVDIFKGCDVSPFAYKLGNVYKPWYGKGESLTKNEVERILHNLLVGEYLCEVMLPNNNIMTGYVTVGKNAPELLNTNNVQIFLQRKRAVSARKTIVVPATSTAQSETNAELLQIENQCYTELCTMVNGIAGALNVSANSIMNIEALRVMSKQLPKKKEDMLRIPHVTKANFEKYGKALLDITQKFAIEKEGLLKLPNTTYKEPVVNNTIVIDDFIDDTELTQQNWEVDTEWTPNRAYNPHRPYKRSNYRSHRRSKKFKYDNFTNYVSTPMRNYCTGQTPSTSTNKASSSTQTTFIPKRPTKSEYFTQKSSKQPSKKSSGPGLCTLTKK